MWALAPPWAAVRFRACVSTSDAGGRGWPSIGLPAARREILKRYPVLEVGDYVDYAGTGDRWVVVGPEFTLDGGAGALGFALVLLEVKTIASVGAFNCLRDMLRRVVLVDQDGVWAVFAISGPSGSPFRRNTGVTAKAWRYPQPLQGCRSKAATKYRRDHCSVRHFHFFRL